MFVTESAPVTRAEKLAVALFSHFRYKTFTREQAVVAAWESFPKEFGLKGYNLPDSVASCSKLGLLIDRRLLERTDVGVYQMKKKPPFKTKTKTKNAAEPAASLPAAEEAVPKKRRKAVKPAESESAPPANTPVSDVVPAASKSEPVRLPPPPRLPRFPQSYLSEGREVRSKVPW